jgi:2-polyprenyl-3-methyl-5-hydroxy-6-metoxy-1,4-benzoquinol methylase
MTPIGWRDPELEKELCVDGLDGSAARRVFDHLTRYLQKELPEIAASYWEKKKGSDAQAQLQAVQASSRAELDRYYQETPLYLYELSYWEATRDKQKWFEVLRKACRQSHRQKVLDFGGGVGGLTLSLRQAGIACDHLDVPGRTRAYAAWRFDQGPFQVRVWSAGEPLPREAYDAAIAWDVFEHLVDLEKTLGQIRDLLRPGGWLLSKSTFAESEQHHIHLEKNRIYNDIRVWNHLLDEQGFDYVGQLKSGRISRLLEKTFGWHHPLGIRIVPKLKHGGNFLIHKKRRSQ